jgi:hypothetical protein
MVGACIHMKWGDGEAANESPQSLASDQHHQAAVAGAVGFGTETITQLKR